jgi:hypothetical protein
MNEFRSPGSTETIFVEDFVSDEELSHGAVQVITASAGVCEGYLSPSSAYWEVGGSCFEVRTVFMENPLSRHALTPVSYLLRRV